MDGTDDTSVTAARNRYRCEGNRRKQCQLYLYISTCKEMENMEILSPPQTHLIRGIDIRLIAE